MDNFDPTAAPYVFRPGAVQWPIHLLDRNGARKESEVKSLSRVRLFAIPWTVVYKASLSMGFSRQEYWSGLPFPSPGDLPEPGTGANTWSNQD